MPLLEADGLSKHFRTKRGLFGGDHGLVRAVDEISFAIESGQTLGVVGESGCGKTTTAKLVLGLEEPTGGTIRFDGRDLRTLAGAGRRYYRKSVQAVFQDPYASLSPRMRIGAIIAEPLVTNETQSASEVRKRVSQLLDLVGLPESARPICFRMSFRVGSGSGSRSRGPWRCRQNWSCSTSRFPRSMFRSGRRSSICCAICRASLGFRICLSPTISPRSRI